MSQSDEPDPYGYVSEDYNYADDWESQVVETTEGNLILGSLSSDQEIDLWRESSLHEYQWESAGGAFFQITDKKRNQQI